MSSVNPLGYSGTPLSKKLGIKSGQKVKLINEPRGYRKFFNDLPVDFNPVGEGNLPVDLIHYFATETRKLEEDLPVLRDQIQQNGMIWISWPKKSSGYMTNLDGNAVRSIGLKNGLVDIKVCSVNEVWSALKFVIPVKDRK